MKFDPAPIFVNLPYATTGLGGRRWRMWQSQLGSIGKVYPIILPEGLSDLGQCTSLKEVAEQMFTSSLTRVQEVRRGEREEEGGGGWEGGKEIKKRDLPTLLAPV